MVERYAREEMTKHWTQHARYAAWLEVEKAAVKAWAKLGKIPQDDADKKVGDFLNKKYNVDGDKLKEELEKKYGKQ